MTHRLHSFLHDTQFRDLPPQMIQRARHWLLDLVGVAVAGRRTALSDIICDHAVEHFAGQHGALLFDGRKASAAGIALAGGMTIDAVDGHDGHKLTKGHTGCGLLPALLAFAQEQGTKEGAEFLTALVLGYEIATRAGVALHRTAADYHTSGAWIAVGVAAIGGRMIGLDQNRTRQAMGIAEYHGPRSQMMRTIDHPTMVKDGSGWGAMAGVSATYLARAGFTGAPALTIEAEEVADLWADLGTRWYITEQYFKYFTVCRWAQPPLQAILNLRQTHQLVAEDVERIEIATFHQSRRLAVTAPKTTEEAQYSTAYPAAVAMVRGTCGPRDISADSFDDPQVQRLARSMIITEKDAYNAAFPARRIADVTLVLRDGRQVQSEPTEALGDPEDPAPFEDIRAKFYAYAAPEIGQDRARALECLVMGLGRDTDLGDLVATLTTPLSP